MVVSLWAFNRWAAVLVLLFTCVSSEPDVTYRHSKSLLAALLGSTGDRIRADWLQLFHTVWVEKREEVSWCLGSTERGAYEVLQRSLPFPLPRDLPSQDEFCSDELQIGPHLCGAEHIIEYYKVLEIL
jgi:hypothetical protein